jgi:two-component system OmpR family response regulator
MKVLVVEDEPLLASTLSIGLLAEGFVVVEASDGVDGLSQAVENDFDVIVLDIMLPGLSGYEVLRRMRARAVWTPVLMLTAKDGEYDQTDAFELGADDYRPSRSRSSCWSPGSVRWCAVRRRIAPRS